MDRVFCVSSVAMLLLFGCCCYCAGVYVWAVIAMGWYSPLQGCTMERVWAEHGEMSGAKVFRERWEDVILESRVFNCCLPIRIQLGVSAALLGNATIDRFSFLYRYSQIHTWTIHDDIAGP